MCMQLCAPNALSPGGRERATLGRAMESAEFDLWAAAAFLALGEKPLCCNCPALTSVKGHLKPHRLSLWALELIILLYK